MHERIVILDFGGQYAHLIASRIRRHNVLAQILQPDEATSEYLGNPLVKGIILSGGPQSVYDEDSPQCDPAIFELGKPVLGICYGHQFLCHSLGGKVTAEDTKEYGRSELTHDGACPLFKDIPATSPFWMSHRDEVTTLPKGFQVCGKTADCANAAVWNPDKNLFGIQFHPEVTHSPHGTTLLGNFLDICSVQADWTMQHFLDEEAETLKQKVGNRNVVLFVSGGVDSTVAFALLSKILGPDRVRGLFINNGLLRQGEWEQVQTSVKNAGFPLTTLDETNRFLGKLEGITDPEHKRRIIGNTFVEVQHEYFETHQLGDDWVLGQGTIYPDTIETGGTQNSATIKTHHNRVPEIQKMIDQGKVIEPLAQLYKDEVRELGELLGLPHDMVWRHPFPGPGLGVRILCNDTETTQNLSFGNEITTLPIKSVGVQGDARTYRHPAILRTDEQDIQKLQHTATNIVNQSKTVNRVILQLGGEKPQSVSIHKAAITPRRIQTLQHADAVVTQALQKMNLYQRVWQFPVVLIPMGFNGKGQESIILRPIDSTDAMSASVPDLPWEFYETVTTEILQDDQISAVFLDITSKPPGTIEWE